MPNFQIETAGRKKLVCGRLSEKKRESPNPKKNNKGGKKKWQVDTFAEPTRNAGHLGDLAK